jgi:26S proteasome regulatory subunit N8
VGVEHLLRDINDPSTSSLALQVRQKVNGLGGLLGRLQEIRAYLQRVASGDMPMNAQVAYRLQDVLNLLPNLNVEELVTALLVKTNDMHLAVYLSSLVRSVLALHGLLSNKLEHRDMDDLLDKDAAGMLEGDKDKPDKSAAAAAADSGAAGETKQQP